MDGEERVSAAAIESRSHRSLELVLATNESITIDLDPLPSPEELEVVIEILVEEKPPAYFWTALASRCWNQGRRTEAEQIVTKGYNILPVHRPNESTSLFALHAAFQLADARAAPKLLLDNARYQDLSGKQTKQHHFRSAIESLNQAQSLDPQSPIIVLTRAVLALVMGDNALAGKLFDATLSKDPMHAIALLGKACVLLRTRQYMAALHMYQTVLRIALKMDQLAAANNDTNLCWTGPDPRIGLGLCLWGLGRHDTARRAWRRAMNATPEHHAPRLLLGLSLVNAAKQVQALPHGWYGAGTERAEDAARREAYAEGLVLLQSAWRLDKTNAMTAVSLSAHLLSQATQIFAQVLPPANDFSSVPGAPDEAQAAAASGVLDRALKLSEHAIQYADSKSPVIQAWLQYAHALHLSSQLPGNSTDHALRLLSQRYYARASEELAKTPNLPGKNDQDTFQHQLEHGLALATLGLAQLQASTAEPLAAINTLEAVLVRPGTGSNDSYNTELSLFAALLYAQPQPGATPQQLLADRKKARVSLDRTLRLVDSAERLLHSKQDDQDNSLLQAETAIAAEHLSTMTLSAMTLFGTDPRVYALLASLFAPGDIDRAVQYNTRALHLAEQRKGTAALQAALQLNIGALWVLHGAALTHAPSVRKVDEGALRKGIEYLERAFVSADAIPSSPETDAVKILANYDLGRAFEASGDVGHAEEAYRALVAAHPEYAEARVRLAVLAANLEQSVQIEENGTRKAARDVANARFKEALLSDPSNLDTRASYIRFLAGEYPANRQAAWPAIKDISAQLFVNPDVGKTVFGSAGAARRVTEEARHDAWVLSVLGWTYYQIGLHTPAGPTQREDKTKSMYRAADLFDKALGVHPQCVFAAQGLAILLADDALGDASAAPEAVEERRRNAAEDAVGVFGRLREVRDDASVYVCQGHAYMRCNDLERAVHVYELALTRHHNEKNPMVLQYLARAEYALGLRQKEFALLEQAVCHLDTSAQLLAMRGDESGEIECKQIAYNRAVMAQKALQMLYDLPVEQRGAAHLQEAIGWVRDAQPVLETLEDAAKKGQLLYITAEVVEQRAKYAEISLLRQAESVLEETRTYEEQHQQQLVQLNEKQREKETQLLALRREKEEEHRRRAEAIAASRRRAREEASQIEYLPEPSPEPKKRSTRRKKAPQPQPQPQTQQEFVAEESSEEDALFREDESDSDSSDSDAEQADTPQDVQAEHTASSAPKSTREKLAELARQRRKRKDDEENPSKKRRSDKERKEHKKPKPNPANPAENATIDSDEEMKL